MSHPTGQESSSSFVSDPAPEAGNTGTVLIISSFAGFNGRTDNPSQVVARKFAGEVEKAGLYLVSEVRLNVVWDEDTREIRRHIAQAASTHPGTQIEWIAFGQGQDRFQMETTARNARHPSLGDNRGRQPGVFCPATGKTVSLWNKDGGEPELHASQEDFCLLEALGMPESAGAGQFLCESVLYELLDMSRPDGPLHRGRFFHIPFDPPPEEIEGFACELCRLLFAGRS